MIRHEKLPRLQRVDICILRKIKVLLGTKLENSLNTLDTIDREYWVSVWYKFTRQGF